MQRIAGLSALLVAAALICAETCRAQNSSDDGSYAQLLAKYDRNGNGLLDDRERAALLAPAPAEDQQALSLSANPLICEGQLAESAGGSSASVEQQSLSPPQVALHLRWRRQQFVEDQPPGDPQPNQANPAAGALLAEESPDGYAPETSPQPPEPTRQSVRFRNVVQYRMLLNESQAQPRSQPFARAATFGPIIGRSKQQSGRYRAANVDVCCGSTRATLYRLTGYRLTGY